jgi:excisionase family DNA binding protein
MAKNVSFDNLPKTVEKILDILTAEGSDHTALPELLHRVTVTERRLDKIEQLLSPDEAKMDKYTVLRLLKIRPKMLSEMELSGVLVSHSEGRRTFYYERDVVLCFMNQSSWKAAIEEASKPGPVESAPDKPQPVESEPTPATDGLIDIDAAAEIIGKSKWTIYKLIKDDALPHIRKGRGFLFDAEKLKLWLEENSFRRREPQSNVTEKPESKAPEVSPSTAEATGRIDIKVACEIVGRNPAAIYQLIKTKSIPNHKEGRKVYFIAEELREWIKIHPPRKYTRRNETKETAQ